MTGLLVTLEFWGTAVDVHLSDPRDESRIRHYFRDYLRTGPSEHSAMGVRLSAEDGAFSGDQQGHRQVEVQLPGEPWRLYERYIASSVQPTLLPPLQLSPLREEMRTVHGAALSPPRDPGRAVVITGQSTVGKTTLMLSLLEAGWHFITDDLVVISRDNQIMRFTRPVGVRESALTRFKWLAKSTESAPHFFTPTGQTRIPHPRDLPVSIGPDRAAWTWTVDLCRDSSFSTEWLSSQTVRVRCNIDVHLQQAVRTLMRLVAQRSAL